MTTYTRYIKSIVDDTFNPYFVSEAIIFEDEDGPLSEIYCMEVDEFSKTAVIKKTLYFQYANVYRNIEAHTETEYLCNVYFDEFETILDLDYINKQLIDLCQKYSNNPVKNEVL
jgi:hypothetical protein